MKYFVLWSGGLDSTYLILNLLEKGHDVEAGYVNIGNNTPQMEREEKAREQLLKHIEEMQKKEKFKGKFCFSGIIFSMTVERGKPHSDLQQASVFISALQLSNPRVDRIALGYVKGDDGTKYISKIKKVFYSINHLNKREKISKLEFPLSRTSKQTIIKRLKKKYSEFPILDHITFCEGDVYSFFNNLNGRCGRCGSCKRWNEAIGAKDLAEEREKNVNSIKHSPEIYTFQLEMQFEEPVMLEELAKDN